MVAGQNPLGPRLREDDGDSAVIPAQAGIQEMVASGNLLGPRLREDDGKETLHAFLDFRVNRPSGRSSSTAMNTL